MHWNRPATSFSLERQGPSEQLLSGLWSDNVVPLGKWFVEAGGGSNLVLDLMGGVASRFVDSSDQF